MFEFLSDVDQAVRLFMCHILVGIGVFLTDIAAGFIRAGAWIADIDYNESNSKGK